MLDINFTFSWTLLLNLVSMIKVRKWSPKISAKDGIRWLVIYSDAKNLEKEIFKSSQKHCISWNWFIAQILLITENYLFYGD